jgi:ribonuclease D
MVKFADSASRNFNPMSVSGLSSKAGEAVNDAFTAMSTWRAEIAENNEKNLKRVIDKMTVAAEAMGWPEQIAEAARSQLKNITEMQTKTIDHLMDAWEAQLKSPNPMTASSEMLSKLKSIPGLGTSGNGLNALPANPMEFWTQFAQQCQKSWTDAMALWARGGKPH